MKVVERQAVSAPQRNPPMGRPLYWAPPGSQGQMCPNYPLVVWLVCLHPQLVVVRAGRRAPCCAAGHVAMRWGPRQEWHI